MPAACFHLLPGTGADWLGWAATGAPAIKVCNAALIAPAKALGCQVYLRPYLGGDDGDCGDGAAWAQQVIAAIRAAGGEWPDVLGYRNECNPSAAQRAQYDRYRVALHAAGFPGVVTFGSFSVGRPDWPDYANLAGAEAVELHEYLDMSVAGSAPYYALRHVEAIRRGLLSPDLPLFIGEWGSDALGIEDAQRRRGWQDRGKLTAAQQVANLTAYRAGCAPSVRAVFVFADGPTPPAPAGWSDFATRGTPVEAAIRATWPAQQTGATVASLPIPLDNQLTSDGPNKYNECGPACIRMVCDYLGVDPGEAIDAIDVDETGDEWYVGYTTTEQMVAWFTARGVAAVQSQPQDMGAAVAANLARGWPCVWLGVWNRQALTGGHFETPVAVDSAGAVTLNNPYGGYQETLSAADFARYSLGWLVTVQRQKETTVPTDPLTAAAVARFSALGVQPNQAGACFKAYKRMVAAWLANGQDGVLDPTPALRPEAVLPDGSHAYLALDSGRVIVWRRDTGLCYQAEAKDLPTIAKACGWS